MSGRGRVLDLLPLVHSFTFTTMRHLLSLSLIFFVFTCVHAQVPLNIGVEILKAEDARRYDSVLEKLMTSPSADVRERAALAAGRIGDDRAIPELAGLLAKDSSQKVRTMAAFAIGEVESVKGADAILTGLKAGAFHTGDTRGRLVEAAGKIAAANGKDPVAKQLGAAIVEVLRAGSSDRLTIRLALTAALRARPDGAAPVVAKYADNTDSAIREDALNTLARLRSKERLADIRTLLQHDTDPIVRANAARVLGGAEDHGSYGILVDQAVNSGDSRVRVSCIRALGQLKDAKAADPLLTHAESLLTAAKRSRFKHPAENAEMIEIATVLGQLLRAKPNARALKFLDEFARLDNGLTPDISIARMRIAPSSDFENSTTKTMGWREMSTDAQVLGSIADLDPKIYPDTPEFRKLKEGAPELLQALLAVIREPGQGDDKKTIIAMPDVLSAYAKFKTDDLDEVLRLCLERSDPMLRAAAAGLMADRPALPENIAALKAAFTYSFVRDKHDDDAMLAIMGTLHKLNKKESAGSLLTALTSPDYLVRKRAFELLSDAELQKEVPGIPTLLEAARSRQRDQVLPYTPAFGTKLGQVLNTDADYRRALSRRNGSVRAVLTTEKGAVTIVFTPEEAPLTVDNLIKLARAGYFNGLEVHRVVPNFVMQDGDPRGDGNGGPGWSIRCEVNMLPYDRGAVGMALSGKDTGGSQWFVTHSPQPHLDGGYTVFGHVDEKDMKVVDSIVRGDRILSVRVVGR